MSKSYLPKLNPKIGGGLGGLPERVEVAEAKPRGEMTFSIPATYSWTPPEGVDTISIVCVGGGGGGHADATTSATGGAGGGLAWANNIPVNRDSAITVVVGAGGVAVDNENGDIPAGDGGVSYVQIDSTQVCTATGGEGGHTITNAIGGTFTNGDGGGSGGAGIRVINSRGLASGGGAGGYSGNGGAGKGGTADAAGNNGAGGGGGSGGIEGTTSAGAGGGGVGLFGLGANGAGGATGTQAFGGGGGSGGLAGGTSTYSTKRGDGGIHGGGGGGSVSGYSGSGGHGAVRIIWGEGRAFPSTDCGIS